MPAIRNSALIKRFTDFFKLKTNDFLGSEAGRMLVPVITEPIPVNIIKINDEVLNDADKTFTVPSGKQWKLLYGRFFLVSSAQAGNRRMRFRVTDSDNNEFYSLDARNNQAASVTEAYILGNFVDVEETVNQIHTIPIPTNFIIPENFIIRISDSASIDLAVDDLTVNLIIEEINVTGE